jgi:hypothetical protein
LRRLGELVALDAQAQLVEQVLGGLDADVGSQEDALQFLVEFFIDLRMAAEQFADRGVEYASGLAQALFEALRPGGGGRCVSLGGRGGGLGGFEETKHGRCVSDMRLTADDSIMRHLDDCFTGRHMKAAWVLAIAALGWVSAPARAANDDVVETLLGNGMKVVVKPDRRAPVVVSQVWYRAGSMDESYGTTGVAHVLEHMMFKGTKAVPSGEFSKRIAAVGGRENAFTSRDHTAYFQTLRKEELPLALKLEADRMANLVLSSEEFAKEINVVMEERRLRTEDNPQSLLYEKLMSVAYKSHPYRHPVIGWMDDLKQMTVEDARRWYQSWYAPNNATLVVVGDVDPQAGFLPWPRSISAPYLRAICRFASKPASPSRMVSRASC